MSDNLKALPVLHLDDESFTLDANAFKSVLHKAGNLPIVILSINGPTRTGKSYLLNHFIWYFEFKKRDPSCTNWYDSKTNSKSNFGWRGGRVRETVGINLWPEPYFVNTNTNTEGEKLAVLLMDTQGLFDEQTTARQNAIIFSISTLCSSVMMFNIMQTLKDDVLQQVELYSGYAHMASAYQNKAHENNKSSTGGSNSNYIHGSKLMFLIRDFQPPEYEYGLYTKDKSPLGSALNYYTETFHLPQHFPEQNKIVRQNIQRNFRDISIYCLPSPGTSFIRQKKENAKDMNVSPEADFQKCVIAFVENMVEPENLVRKTVLGQPTTGVEFIEYIDAWAELCANTTDIFPDVNTTADSTAFTQYFMACNVALSKYKNEMDAFVDEKRGSATPTEMDAAHNKFAKDARELYKAHHKMPHLRFEREYSKKLDNDLEYCGEVARRQNKMYHEAIAMAGQNEEKLLEYINVIKENMHEERVRMDGIIRGFKDTTQVLIEQNKSLTESLEASRREQEKKDRAEAARREQEAKERAEEMREMRREAERNQKAMLEVLRETNKKLVERSTTTASTPTVSTSGAKERGFIDPFVDVIKAPGEIVGNVVKGVGETAINVAASPFRLLDKVFGSK